ncbi:hypothetical protein LN451_08685, partial [Xanthomonas hortorum pv. gardneri]|uniref:hypothetical protein n=1 Tax=Xanthomonas hortorum TaxID=56454 RepID=UPI001E5C1715
MQIILLCNLCCWPTSRRGSRCLKRVAERFVRYLNWRTNLQLADQNYFTPVCGPLICHFAAG